MPSETHDLVHSWCHAFSYYIGAHEAMASVSKRTAYLPKSARHESLFVWAGGVAQVNRRQA